ncbi:XRE family transcriptional regulator [Streptomyces viridochromogenes]|uniref:XRE family transcriptional regulator n=1 Tax=Streptomyces viridochromogenes TaxID=1938 RepID=A0A0J7Z973_STRVR|nr:helix-turn-helix transcriptional regulator [Streptomyces viridochromogenes]KMS72369.1 XRE family transcriptional regulator [Streptomyces viridochromogenes]
MTTQLLGPLGTLDVGILLRRWRDRRGVSQLELASRADSSARHISFIETGRAKPSHTLLLRLAEQLDVPVRERNTLLIAAGFAPVFPETPLNDPAMRTLNGELERLLAVHDPNPALVHDYLYNVVGANRSLLVLVSGVADHLLTPPINTMRLALHPEGMAPAIRNLAQWRAHLLDQMERQIAVSGSAPLADLYEEVAAYPVADSGTPEPTARAPYALPLLIEREGRQLSFVSMLTTFNTPLDVTVSELAIETFLPSDQETAAALRDMLGEIRPPEAGPESR